MALISKSFILGLNMELGVCLRVAIEIGCPWRANRYLINMKVRMQGTYDRA
jgi:hypothetical protein